MSNQLQISLHFGEKDENDFNSWVVDTLKSIEGWYSFKIHGSMFQQDKPDVYFAGSGESGFVENKFVDALKRTTRDSTVMVGYGCKKRGKKWSPGQLREISDLMNCESPLVVGGLIGVLGTREEPDLVIGVRADHLLDRFYLTAGELRKLRLVAREVGNNYLQVLRYRTGEVTVLDTYDDLPLLLVDMA